MANSMRSYDDVRSHRSEYMFGLRIFIYSSTKKKHFDKLIDINIWLTGYL